MHLSSICCKNDEIGISVKSLLTLNPMQVLNRILIISVTDSNPDMDGLPKVTSVLLVSKS